MITVPQLDPVSQIQATDVIMITHADGTTEKITGENFMKAMAVDVIAENNMNSVTSNAVFNVTKKYTSGAVTLNPSYVTGGSIEWLKVGRLVIIKITALKLTTWSDGDKTIATGLPPAQRAIQFFLAPLNSGSSSQLFAVQTNGLLDTNGGSSHPGDFYGTVCYFSAE